MSQDKPKLTGYSLKLCDNDQSRIKLICAKREDFKFQYEFFDAAVEWAHNNKDCLQPVANKRTGTYRSYYLNKADDLLEQLEQHWDCSTTRALYTAVLSFIEAQEESALKGM